MDSIDIIKPQFELSESPPEQETLDRLSPPSLPFSCVFLGLIKKVSLGFDNNKIYIYMQTGSEMECNFAHFIL